MTIFKNSKQFLKKKKHKSNQLYVYEVFKDYRKYIEKKFYFI